MMNQELVTMEKNDAMIIFTKKRGLDPFLEKIRGKIDAFVPDMHTSQGRKNIASIAHKVSRSKTYLDGIGKELVTELKEKPKLIDLERKRVRTILDDWKDEVRQPLTDWEDAEQERVDRHKANFRLINEIKEACTDDVDSGFIQGLIFRLQKIRVDDSWEEFINEAAVVHAHAMGFLKTKKEARLIYEREQRELHKLRREMEARELKDREEKIAREAALREAEKSRQREEDLKRRAQLAELKKRDAEEQSEKNRILAAERAEEEKQAAIQAERDRIDAQRRKAEAAEKSRQEDLEHRKFMNNTTIILMIKNGIDDGVGRKIVTLSAQGKLGGLMMNY